MQLKNVFIFLSQIISLFTFVLNFTILEVPLIYKPYGTDDRYSLYFSGYSKPIALSFGHSFSYLRSAFFTERYTSINEYPPSLGKSEYFKDYNLYSNIVSFNNSNIPFTFYFYCNINSSPETQLKDYDNILTLRYSKNKKVKHIANELYYQNIIPSPTFALSLKENML